MIKLLILGACAYFAFKWWSEPNQLPAEKREEEDYIDYEEIE